MKKLKYWVSVGMLCILLTACGSKKTSIESKYTDVNTLDGLVLATEESVYDNSIESIKLIFTNDLQEQFVFGEEIILEIEEDGEWYQVIPSSELAWNDIGIILAANSTSEDTIELTAYHNYLEDGHYRFIKNVYMQEEDKTTPYVVAAEFNVGNTDTNLDTGEGAEKAEETEKVEDADKVEETGKVGETEELYLTIDKDQYFLDSEEVSFTVTNRTGEELGFVSAPRLEKETGLGWEKVECNVGFCGTPDPLKETKQGNVLLLWYPNLTEGKFRLSFEVYDNYEMNNEGITISDTFELVPAEAENTGIVTVSPTNKSEILFKKPVIYLYPEKEMAVNVSLDLDGEFVFTYPNYEDGWEVTASPDGTLINHKDGLEYSYLFWEGISDATYDMSEGFVVAGKDTMKFLQEKLSYLGLTPKEYNEFIVFWLPLMEENPYNLITFQGEAYTDSAKLHVSPQPDSVLRVFMVYKPLNEWIDIKEQELSTFERTGFTVIEWGGSEIK